MALKETSLDYKITGTGKMVYYDGTSFEGDFKDGFPVGNGKGKMLYSNGDIYEGELKDGNPFGKGKMLYSNGDIYEGSFYKYKNFKYYKIYTYFIK